MYKYRSPNPESVNSELLKDLETNLWSNFSNITVKSGYEFALKVIFIVMLYENVMQLVTNKPRDGGTR